MFTKLRQRIADWLKLERAVQPWEGGETNNNSLCMKDAYTIEFLDDNKTTYMFVVGALINCFNVDANTALDLATTLDRTGRITVGRMTKSVALGVKDHLETEARERSFPLEVNVRTLLESRNKT